MAKKALKQLLLVILALSILMVGTTNAFAEKSNDKELIVFRTISPFGDNQVGKKIARTYSNVVVTDSLDSLQGISNPCWLFFFLQEYGDSPELPEGPDYQAIFYVDSVVTPEPQTLDELYDTWIGYLLKQAQTGVPIYIFASHEISGAADMLTAQLNQLTFTKLAELAEDSEYPIIKSEDDENTYLVLNENKEAVGSIYTLIVEGSTTNALLDARNCLFEQLDNFGK